ncbi:MAG: class I SAM-dependent methyltransferase [Alphaproteobacteria bacterium]|nr:class I SAM-dependent methyltransferase [Alphaproteobacteria bacterium]
MTTPPSEPTFAPFPATGMPDGDWWQALWPDPLNVMRRLGFAAGQRVVDLCCGDGLFSLALLRLGCFVEGLDGDQELLGKAEQSAQAAGYNQARWHLGDAREPDRLIHPPVDSVLIANTFHGVSEYEPLCRSVRRLLLPQGRLVIINWHARPREETTILGLPRGPRSDLRLTPEQTAKHVQPSGFRQDEIIELPPFHYASIFSIR